MSETVVRQPAGISLRGLAIVLGGSALLAVSAWTSMPMWPVPMTMQTFVVLLLGLFGGPVLGVAAIMAYLGEAALGLPVLAGGHALTAIGPTSGYLIGFALSAGLVGWMARRGWSHGWRLAVTLAIGSAVVFVPGLLVLRNFLPDWSATIANGLIPFLPGAVLKAALAAAVFAAVPKRFRAHA